MGSRPYSGFGLTNQKGGKLQRAHNRMKDLLSSLHWPRCGWKDLKGRPITETPEDLTKEGWSWDGPRR